MEPALGRSQSLSIEQTNSQLKVNTPDPKDSGFDSNPKRVWLHKLKQNATLWMLLFPAYGWLVFAILIPLLIMLSFSFLSDVPFGNRVVVFTFENYTDYFNRTFYWKLTNKSLLTGLYTTLFCILIAYPMALIIAKVVPGRWRSALFMLVIVPFWSNTLVRLYSWAIVLRNGGVIDLFLQFFGLPSGSLELLYTYPAIIIGLVHGYLPYMILTLYIAMDRIDNSMLEAAASLGASRWQSFWRILFPLSLPGMISGSILIFIPSIGSFIESRILGGRSGTLIGTIIEDQFIQLFNWPFGAALAFIMLIIVLLLMGAMALLLVRMRLLRVDKP
jgi:spermidine/putrescine transport system permease protein